jgi:CheY-like chemotaxis protein
MPATILVCDDDSAIRTVLNQALGRAGYDVRTTGTAAGLWRWISAGEGNLVITDVVLPDESGFRPDPAHQRMRPDLPILVMSAQNTCSPPSPAAERGAFEYLPKPFDLKELTNVVGRALVSPQSKRDKHIEAAEERPALDRPLAGDAGNLPRHRAADPDRPDRDDHGRIGTGKELVARALHDYGKRRHGTSSPSTWRRSPRNWWKANCSAMSAAPSPAPPIAAWGAFEQAEGGTLFLDEIGDMPLEAQTRLLRVLQQGEYTTVGGRTPIKTDVRIIAATNRDLRQLISQGMFREGPVLPAQCRAAAAAALARAGRGYSRPGAPLPAQGGDEGCRTRLWTMKRSTCCGRHPLARQCARVGKSDPAAGGAAIRRYDSAAGGQCRTEGAGEDFLGGFRRRAAIPGRVGRAISDPVFPGPGRPAAAARASMTGSCRRWNGR